MAHTGKMPMPPDRRRFTMRTLTRASEELFRRGPDECFATFDALWRHCQEAKA